MGFYIETNGAHGKADYLVATHNAVKLDSAPAWSNDHAIVCVVNNGLFEAAALAYSPDELRVFSDASDPRPKTWLRMDKDTAHLLAGYFPK